MKNETVDITRERLNWPLIAGLAALALVRPLFSIVGWSETLGKPLTPLLLTLAISAVWILVVGLGSVRNPVLTLLLAGLGYAVLSILVSGILSPILRGEMQGPLASPLALGPVLITNALWGLVTGALALGLQRLRGNQRSGTR